MIPHKIQYFKANHVPVKEYIFQGVYTGMVVDRFPEQQRSLVFGGDSVVIEENTIWVCVYSAIENNSSNSVCQFFYIPYEQCLVFGIEIDEKLLTRIFEKTYQFRYNNANSTKDYVELLDWLHTGSFAVKGPLKYFEKVTQIALANRESVEEFQQNVSPVHARYLEKMIESLNNN